MGGEKKWFCPVVLPIILIDLINSGHLLRKASLVGGGWGGGGGVRGVGD